MAHEMYKLDGDVHETVISGERSDNSHFCKLEKLVHCLGPSMDVSPAMTAKILTENGQLLHRSTFRPLNPDELLDKVGSAIHRTLWPESMKRWSH